MGMSELLSERQVAEQLQIAAGTLANWRSQGTGPRYVKLGRAVRYRPADIEAWIEGNNA